MNPLTDAVAVSVVLCVRNGASTLPRQLAALHAQRTSVPWELVVVDNGSRDGSGDVARAWNGRIPRLRVVAEPQRGLNRARNRGVGVATGRYVLCCDADDEVAPGWIDALCRGLDRFDLVGGALTPFPADHAHPLRDRVPQREGLPRALGCSYAVGANFGFRREVFDSIGGFDDAYTYGSDEIDFCIRAHNARYAIGFVPDAVVGYGLRTAVASMLHQGLNYGVGYQRLLARVDGPGVQPPGPLRRWRNVGGETRRLLRRVPEAGRGRAAGIRYAMDVAFVVGEVVQLTRECARRGS